MILWCQFQGEVMICRTRVAAERMREVDGVDNYFRYLSQQQIVINQLRKLNKKVVKNILQVSGLRNQVDSILICQ